MKKIQKKNKIKKMSILDKKLYITNFVYKNIKHINDNIVIEEFESDYSSEEEIIEILDDYEEELISK